MHGRFTVTRCYEAIRLLNAPAVPGVRQDPDRDAWRAIVENKRLGAALAMVKEHQATYTPNKRRYDPARGRPPNNLEAPGLPTKNRSGRGGVATAQP